MSIWLPHGLSPLRDWHGNDTLQTEASRASARAPRRPGTRTTAAREQRRHRCLAASRMLYTFQCERHEKEITYDVVVAGAGVAQDSPRRLWPPGTASPTVVVGMLPGGPLLSVAQIDDFPGFPNGVAGSRPMPDGSGPSHGTPARSSKRLRSSESSQGMAPGPPPTADGDKLSARAVIVATGTEPRTLGVPGEERAIARHLALRELRRPAVWRVASVAVIGGGDSALMEAIELTANLRTR